MVDHAICIDFAWLCCAGFPSWDHPVRPCCTPSCGKRMTPQFHFCQFSDITKDDVVGILGTRITPCEALWHCHSVLAKVPNLWGCGQINQTWRKVAERNPVRNATTNFKESKPADITTNETFHFTSRVFCCDCIFSSCPETSGSLCAFTETTLTTLRCNDSAPSYTTIFEGINFACFHSNQRSRLWQEEGNKAKHVGRFLLGLPARWNTKKYDSPGSSTVLIFLGFLLDNHEIFINSSGYHCA